MNLLRLVLLCTLATLTFACGGGSSDNIDAADTNLPDSSTLSGDWVPLITGDWTLAAGTEDTGDNHIRILDRDIYVGAIRPIEPVGTHHTVLATNGSAGVIYASGVGTNAVTFPQGVGLKLTAGTVLALQLHIFNTSDAAISGTSGIEIIEIAPQDVVQEADLFLPGPTGFNLVPGQETTFSGTCTITREQTLFALFPHMHQLGTHFKMTITKNGQDQVLHDLPYDFNEQAFTVFNPITLMPGDVITSECTWFNSLNQNVTWGESSTSEMCFGIMYRYPAGGSEGCND